MVDIQILVFFLGLLMKKKIATKKIKIENINTQC